MKNCVRLTPSDFAKEIAIPLRTVQHWCKRGRIPADKNDSGRYVIPSYAVDMYRAHLLPAEVN